MIKTAVRNMLIADSSVSALVGTRVYSGKFPQTLSYPAVLISEISNVQIENNQYYDKRIRLSISDENSTQADTLRELCKKALIDNSYEDTDIAIQNIQHEFETETYFDDVTVYTRIVDFRMNTIRKT